MMFYEKSIKRVPKSTKSVVLTNFSGGIDTFYDESVLPFKYAKMSYNFNMESGALKDGCGLELFKVNGGTPIMPEGALPLKCYFYKRYDYSLGRTDDRLMIYCSDNRIYELRLNGGHEFTEVEGLEFDSPPQAVSYKYNSDDSIIFSAEGAGLKIYSGEGYPLEVADTPPITSMCFHYERLFATAGGDRTSLWFSDDFDPANWYVSLDEAGFIDMPGERGALLKVISFLDYVYVFRSYGIARVTAYASQTEFSASQLFVSSGKIIGDTVTLCGDRIIFLAEDGLYQFDGIYTRRILEGYDGLLCKSGIGSAKGEFLNGRFYLMLDLEIDGELKRTVINYNISEKTSYISLYNADDIVKIAADDYSEIVYIYEGKLCKISQKAKLLNENLKKVWRSPTTDLSSPGEEKLLKEIRLRAKGGFCLSVYSGREKKTFNRVGKGGFMRIKINIRGSVFGFEIQSVTTGTEISKPVLIYDVLR